MTKKILKKDDIIRNFDVIEGKVIAFVNNVINPTLQQMYDWGWEDYVYPEPEPYIPTKEELVEIAIRNGIPDKENSPKYSSNQEYHALRCRDTEPERFAEYYAFVEECIAWAEKQPHKKE